MQVHLLHGLAFVAAWTLALSVSLLQEGTAHVTPEPDPAWQSLLVIAEIVAAPSWAMIVTMVLAAVTSAVAIYAQSDHGRNQHIIGVVVQSLYWCIGEDIGITLWAPTFPHKLSQLSPLELTRVLHRAGTLDKALAVSDFESDRIGEGVGFLSCMYRLRVSYYSRRQPGTSSGGGAHRRQDAGNQTRTANMDCNPTSWP